MSDFTPVPAAATEQDVASALKAARKSWAAYRKCTPTERAAFLRAIADEIEHIGDVLIQCACTESNLPEARIRGERGRTTGQLRMFAAALEQGNWLAEIEEASEPERQPMPKPSLRLGWVSLGPVVVFGASNFPLAFSTAGGDTASALAAGCPVVVKAHEAHPQTNALVAGAIQKAAEKTNMPEGVFSTLYGGHDLGKWLVMHPDTAAVAFTGSFRGGKSLMDLAAQRNTPIPVFAEMGSINPVFLLPERLETDSALLASQLAGSVCLGAGQFCTNPGVIVAVEDETIFPAFKEALINAFATQAAAAMLTPAIQTHYDTAVQKLLDTDGVDTFFQSTAETGGRPVLASVAAHDFIENAALREEVFGPSTLLVRCNDEEEFLEVAESLQGQLTATLMATPGDVEDFQDLIDILEVKAGRIILNNVPTGVEVSAAMHHGGPWPATTDSRFTSVGTTALFRFLRPVCWQGF